jgi:hypothetical protein
VPVGQHRGDAPARGYRKLGLDRRSDLAARRSADLPLH